MAPRDTTTLDSANAASFAPRALRPAAWTLSTLEPTP
jgi:hypothetical protein